MICRFARLSAAAAVAFSSASAQRTPSSATAAITPGLALATFDSAWAKVDRTFYDTVFLATRWTALRDSLRPIAAKAKTNGELRTVLQTLVASTGVSHFGLIPRELSPAIDDSPALKGSLAAPDGEPGNIGASLRLAGDKLVVWHVDSGGPAWRSGVRPGTEVIRVDKSNVSADIAQLARVDNESVRRQARLTAVMHANAMLTGSVGDTVTLELGTTGASHPVKIERGPVRGTMSRFGNLPPLNALLDVNEHTVATPRGTKRIGVISFSVWLPVLARGIDQAFDRLRTADGIVIDLRGNPGGLAGMVGGVSGHMLDSVIMMGTLTQRTMVLKLNANPRRVNTSAEPVKPYAGPVAILMDPLSGSTSEFFAAGLQGIGRAHIVGETSAGAALPALMDRLPNGDVLLHAIADLTDSRGRRVEGVGVIPDEVVPLRASALLEGRDEALDAAIKWVSSQRPPNS